MMKNNVDSPRNGSAPNTRATGEREYKDRSNKDSCWDNIKSIYVYTGLVCHQECSSFCSITYLFTPDNNFYSLSKCAVIVFVLFEVHASNPDISSSDSHPLCTNWFVRLTTYPTLPFD